MSSCIPKEESSSFEIGDSKENKVIKINPKQNIIKQDLIKNSLNTNYSIRNKFCDSVITTETIKLTDILFGFFNDIQQILMTFILPKNNLLNKYLDINQKINIIKNIVNEVKELKKLKDEVTAKNKQKNFIISNLNFKIKNFESFQKESIEKVRTTTNEFKYLNTEVKSLSRLIRRNSSFICFVKNDFNIINNNINNGCDEHFKVNNEIYNNTSVNPYYQNRMNN